MTQRMPATRSSIRTAVLTAVAVLMLAASTVSPSLATTSTASRTAPSANAPATTTPPVGASLLFVVNADHGTATPAGPRTWRLALDVPRADLVWFTDRPARQSGVMTAKHLVASWSRYGFTETPPNAALVVHDSARPRTVIVTLTKPRAVGQRLVFTATRAPQAHPGSIAALHAQAGRNTATIPQSFGHAQLFIDDAIDFCADTAVAQTAGEVHAAVQSALNALDAIVTIADIEAQSGDTSAVVGEIQRAGAILHQMADTTLAAVDAATSLDGIDAADLGLLGSNIQMAANNLRALDVPDALASVIALHTTIMIDEGTHLQNISNALNTLTCG